MISDGAQFWRLEDVWLMLGVMMTASVSLSAGQLRQLARSWPEAGLAWPGWQQRGETIRILEKYFISIIFSYSALECGEHAYLHHDMYIVFNVLPTTINQIRNVFIMDILTNFYFILQTLKYKIKFYFFFRFWNRRLNKSAGCPYSREMSAANTDTFPQC